MLDEIPTKYFSCFTESEAHGLQSESFSNRFLTLMSGLDSLYLPWSPGLGPYQFTNSKKSFINRESCRKEYKGPSGATRNEI